MSEEQLLSTQQAAARLGVTRSAIIQAVHKGTLPGQRVGSRFVLRQADVDAYVPAPGAGTSEKKRASSRRNAAIATQARKNNWQKRANT